MKDVVSTVFSRKQPTTLEKDLVRINTYEELSKAEDLHVNLIPLDVAYHDSVGVSASDASRLR